MSRNLIEELLLSGLPDKDIAKFLAALGTEFNYYPSESDIFKRFNIRLIDKFNEVNYVKRIVGIVPFASLRRRVVLDMLKFLNFDNIGLNGKAASNSSNSSSLPELSETFEIILTEELPNVEILEALDVSKILETPKNYATILLTDISRLEDLSKIIGGDSKFKVALGGAVQIDIVVFANIADIYNVGDVYQNIPKYLFSESPIISCPMNIIHLGKLDDPEYLESLRERFKAYKEKKIV